MCTTYPHYPHFIGKLNFTELSKNTYSQVYVYVLYCGQYKK